MIDTLNLSWGQFVGPIPTRARVTVRMNGPVDASDPEPFKLLAAAGLTSASVTFDLGAAWTEGARSFALEPATLDIGSVLTAAVAPVACERAARDIFAQSASGRDHGGADRGRAG